MNTFWKPLTWNNFLHSKDAMSNADLEAGELYKSRSDSLQYDLTVGSDNDETLEKNKPLGYSMGDGKRFPPPLPDPAEYVVEFDGPDDATHPFNWSFAVK